MATAPRFHTDQFDVADDGHYRISRFSRYCGEALDELIREEQRAARREEAEFAALVATFARRHSASE